MSTNMSTNDFDDIDWGQLARYLNGDLPAAEARALERWFDRDDEHRRVLAEARGAWEASEPLRTGWDANAAVRRLRDAAGVQDALSVSPTTPIRSARRIERAPSFVWPSRRFSTAAIAASIGLLVMSGTLLWQHSRPAAAPASASPIALNEVLTRPGERAEVRLPDGSRVVLGVASRLRYPRDFGVGARALDLEGEAYFDVVHDAKRPFRVRAGAGELEDVGTAFVVRSYSGPKVQVVVARGAVVARRTGVPRDSLLLTANDLAQLDDRGMVRRGHVNVDRFVAWTRGELVFTDATLADVAAELSRWFGVPVVVGDSTVVNRRFTGSFGRQDVGSIVHAIAAATDVAVRGDRDGWRFSSVHSPSKESLP